MDTSKITLSAALQSYYNDEFISLWNTAAKETGLAHLTFAASTTNRASLNVANKVAAKKLAEALVNGKKKAGYAAFNANIRAAQQIVAALEDGASIISLAAVTQSGKTHVMTFAWLGHQLNLIRQGKPQELCYIVTNRSVPVLEATRNDFQQYINSHHGLRFEGDPNEDHIDASDVNKIVVARMKKNERGEIKPMIDEAINLGRDTITLIIDEADEGTDANSSVLSNWFAQAAAAGITLKLVLVSATGYEYNALAHRLIVMTPDEGYAGIYGKKKVPFLSFSSFAALTGIHELVGFSRNEGKDCIAEVIRDVAVACSIGINCEKFGFNGKPLNGGQHIAVRGLPSNTESDEHLIERLCNDATIKAEGFKVVVCYGDSRGGETVESLIQRETKDNAAQRLIIIFTGAGRRGERFPAEVTVFLDFTTASSTRVSLEQGFLGRASGYGKVTAGRNVVVILSDANYDFACRTIFDCENTAVPRAVEAHAAAARNEIVNGRHAFIDAQEASFFAQIERRLIDLGKPRSTVAVDGKETYHINRVNLKDVLDANLISRIEAHLRNARGLEEVSLWTDGLRGDDNLGFCSIARASRNSTGGLTRRYKNDDGSFTYNPSFMFDCVDGQWTLVAIDLPLISASVHSDAGRLLAYVPKNSAYSKAPVAIAA